MSAKNRVIAGDYKGHSVVSSVLGTEIVTESHIFAHSKTIRLDKTTVKQYEILNQANVGFLGRDVIYTVSVEFKDGKKSLLEIDREGYSNFMKYMY